MAAENERRQARLEDPQYRMYLADLFRMSLTGTNAVGDDSVPRTDRNGLRPTKAWEIHPIKLLVER